MYNVLETKYNAPYAPPRFFEEKRYSVNMWM